MLKKDFNVLLDEFLESLQFEDNDLYERTKNGIVDVDELWVLFSQFMRRELKNNKLTTWIVNKKISLRA